MALFGDFFCQYFPESEDSASSDTPWSSFETQDQNLFSHQEKSSSKKKDETICFILAGGKSTRMGQSISKVLLPLGGKIALSYVIDCAESFAHHIYLIVSPEVFHYLQNHPVLKNLQEKNTITFVLQEESLGTGHAFSLGLKAAQEKEPSLDKKKIVVLLGDCPLVLHEHLKVLLEVPLTPDCPAAFLGMNPPDPQGYGRFVQRSPKGYDIVEDEEWASWTHEGNSREEPLCNTGVMALLGDFALSHSHLLPCHKGQYYITDFAQLSLNNRVVEGPWSCFLGMNTPEQRQQVEALLQQRFRERFLQEGGYFLAPETVFLSHDTQASKGVVVHPYCVLGPGVSLGENVTIFSFSHLEGCRGEKNTTFGPFAHIRGTTLVQEYAQVGSFMEIKNSILEPHVKAKHFGYLGDGHIGAYSNIGAGVIFCNYNGEKKESIVVGENNFIGAGCCLVAPLELQQHVVVGAGSVITKNTPQEHLTLSRSDQRFIPLRKNSRYLKKNSKK